MHITTNLLVRLMKLCMLIKGKLGDDADPFLFRFVWDRINGAAENPINKIILTTEMDIQEARIWIFAYLKKC